MEPMMLITLLAVAFAIIFALQVVNGKKRLNAEDKVLKGYFLLGLSGLFAKVVTADGTVTEDEVELTNRIFNRMGLNAAEKSLCLGNFIFARKDGLSARDHAKRFMAYGNKLACEYLYYVLWRVSRADGVVDAGEDKLLREIAQYLGLEESVYQRFKSDEKPHYNQADLRAAGVPESLVVLARC